jgi:hypothetical protein
LTAYGDRTVWLHLECQHAYVNRAEGHDTLVGIEQPPKPSSPAGPENPKPSPAAGWRFGGPNILIGPNGETRRWKGYGELDVIRAAPRRNDEAENAVGAGATESEESKPPNPPRRRTVL